MDEWNGMLKSTTAFAGLDRTIGELSLLHGGTREITALSFARDNRADVNALCSSKLGVSLSGIGSVSRAENGLMLLSLQSDQIWCVQELSSDADEMALISRLGNPEGVYLTNQGDGWASLCLQGRGVIAVLERLCPLDLHLSSFPVDTVSRTVIDHMGAVVIRKDVDAFDILTPRSYAESFLHALESVARHIDNESRLASAVPVPDNNPGGA